MHYNYNLEQKLDESSLGCVGKPEAQQATAHQQCGHGDDWHCAVDVDQVPEHDVGQDGAQATCCEGHSHRSAPVTIL